MKLFQQQQQQKKKFIFIFLLFGNVNKQKKFKAGI